MPGLPPDSDRKDQVSAAGDVRVEGRGLGAEATVTADPMLNARDRAGARRLLVGVRAEDDVAAQADILSMKALQGEQEVGDAALHVGTLL